MFSMLDKKLQSKDILHISPTESILLKSTTETTPIIPLQEEKTGKIVH